MAITHNYAKAEKDFQCGSNSSDCNCDTSEIEAKIADLDARYIKMQTALAQIIVQMKGEEVQDLAGNLKGYLIKVENLETTNNAEEA